jgi:hypothetical protein
MSYNSTQYEKTHRFFKINHTSKGFVWGSEEIDMCRQYLGDNSLNDYLQDRKWFSASDGIYIRHDCLHNELVTWFLLKAQDVNVNT